MHVVLGPIINIALGLLMVGAGLSGKVVFIGTNEPWPLVAIGVFFVGLGVYRIVRRGTDRRQ